MNTRPASLRAVFQRFIPTVVLFLFVCSASGAEQPRRSFDVPAGDAAATLRQFASQAAQQVAFPAEVVRGIKTNRVKGEFTAREALDQMTAGTKLVAVEDADSGALSVRREKSLAEAEKNGASRPGNDRAADRVEGVIKLDTFEVMGTKLLNMDIKRSRDDAQPYVIFNRETIENSGATNLNDFLKNRLTMNTVGQSSDQSTNTLRNTSGVNLRGLGPNQTLILVDGRRMPESFFGAGLIQADLNGIPLDAIERIDVLPTTASGIYGGSATGGVVNVIMRRDYSGKSLRLTYENAFETDAGVRRVDFSASTTFGHGKSNLQIAASHSDGHIYTKGDAGLFARGRNRILANNPDALMLGINVFGAATNIISATAANLTLKSTGASLNARSTSAPIGYAGVLSDNGAALVANAGKQNLNSPNNAQYDVGAQAVIIAPATVDSISATFRTQFSKTMQLFLEGAASNNTSHFPFILFSGLIQLPATAQLNPFNQAIRVAPVTYLPTEKAISRSFTRRVGAGLIFELPAEWKGAADLNWNLARYHTIRADSINTTALGAAAANGLVDLLQDRETVPFDFTPYVTPGSNVLVVSRQWNAALRLTGPIGITLPAGPITLGTLGEYRDLSIPEQIFSTTTVLPRRSQSVTSAYLEARLPLIAPAMKITAARSLDMQVAGRFDDYSISSAAQAAPGATVQRLESRLRSTNHTFGIKYEPIKGVALRVSYGTGFLPPDVAQLVPSTPGTSQLQDTARGNQIYSFSNISGGNPDLKPERSASWSGGVVFDSFLVQGMRLSVDLTKIDKTDNISAANPIISAAGLSAYEAAFPGRIVRGANLSGDLPGWPGPITFANQTLVNISQAEVEAIDVQLDYEMKTADMGSFALFALATWQTHFKTQIVQNSPIIENVGAGSGNPLRFKANAQLTWKFNQMSAGWAVRYFDSYFLNAAHSINLNQGSAKVTSQNYHDVFVSYRFGGRRSGQQGLLGAADWLLDKMEIQATVKNIFNTKPPFDATNTTNYYSFFGSPLPTTYSISVRKSF